MSINDNVALMKRMLESCEERWIERARNCFFAVDRTERKARLQVMTALVLELHEIRKVSIFSTALGEQAIADVIDGDWKSVRMWADHFLFEGESPELIERHRSRWQNFVAICRGACEAAAARAAGQTPRAS